MSNLRHTQAEAEIYAKGFRAGSEWAVGLAAAERKVFEAAMAETRAEKRWRDPARDKALSEARTARASACDAVLRTENKETATVFRRPECIFNYCPNPAGCVDACKSPAGGVEGGSPSPSQLSEPNTAPSSGVQPEVTLRGEVSDAT